MAFVHAPGVVANVFKVTGMGALAARPVGNETAATVVATPGNHGALHEVNYFLRLKSFAV